MLLAEHPLNSDLDIDRMVNDYSLNYIKISNKALLAPLPRISINIVQFFLYSAINAHCFMDIVLWTNQ